MKMKKILTLGLITLNTLGLGWTVNKVADIANKVENIQVVQTMSTNTKQEEGKTEIIKEEPVVKNVEPVVKKEVVEVAPMIVEKTTKESKVKEETEEEVKEIIEESQEVVEEVVEKEEGTQIVDLEDGSTIVYNHDQGVYTFYPSNMGDWFYSFDNEQHLEWAVQTHLNLIPNVEKITSIEVVNTEVCDDGDVILDLNDGSIILYNETTNEYYFWASNMGDWELQVRNAQELKNVVATYMEITHGL